MSGSVSNEASAEPNLTPVLDMVFQLITFFMLVMNFKAASMDLSLKLPVVGSAKMVDTKGTVDLLVLNVDSDGHLKVYGQEKKDIRQYLQTEAMTSLFVARRKNPELKLGDELPSIVVIRADKATRFHLLNRIISSCQEFGFRNFALKAMNKAEGG
ncbi:MAG TPA: biopolymer transporter ExbD [Pirellulales bacterium]|nr:biopolymer transporter ExbD [Pirellulales bacterium]